MRRSRTLAGALVLALAAAAVLTADPTPIAAASSVPPAPFDDGRLGGAEAIEKLGPRIAQIARRHGLKISDLVQQFLSDRTLYLSSDDRLLYVDPPSAGAAEGTPSNPSGTAPTADALTLHSVPGAERVIYLDFDGHLVQDTAWNRSTGGACQTDPYDVDGDPTSFSEMERAAIIGVWARVAEDYRPFSIDVTTEDPGVEAIRRSSSTDLAFGARALVTKSTSLCPNGKTLYSSVCSNGCGGVAYVGVYNYGSTTTPDYYQPAFVFQNGVGWGEKNISEAASHEVGHNLGLSHDGTSSVGYYRGHGSWAPIMGVGYYEAITQWSSGEYSGANQKQDDLVVMQTYGAPARSDDHLGTVAGATALTADAAGAASVTGEITSRTDKDLFVRTVGDGTLTVTATPTGKSPDLDIRLDLLSATGALIASDDPASGSTSGDTATGLAATISIPVAAGTYVMSVDGVGYGDPLSTGYSDYASVGSYRLTTSWTATPSSTTTTAAPTTTTTTTTTLAPTTTTTTTTTVASTTTTTVASTTTTTAPVVTNRLTATASIAVTRSGTKVSGTATVTVTDSAVPALPVSGVDVTGSWYFGTRRVANRSGTTDSSGVVRLTLGGTKAPAGTAVKFCVTEVAKTGYTYTGGTQCTATKTV